MHRITIVSIGIVMLVVGLLIGTGVVNASVVNSFKLKENKMFFTVLVDEENYTLPSTIGRNGHVYIVKSILEAQQTGQVNIIAETGDTVDGGFGVQLQANIGQAILVADED
ncbi:MAG: hypothetical protein WA021_03435, partial [Minisyncoccia bacterium]